VCVCSVSYAQNDAVGRQLDAAMACIAVAYHHQRRPLPMKNGLIKPKRKSVIPYHGDAKHLDHNVTNTPNKLFVFR